jgi:cytochrome c-type biogenesis protein CcmH/NrfG
MSSPTPSFWKRAAGTRNVTHQERSDRGGERALNEEAAAGVVSLFLLWPLAVTAAIGAWNQMKLPERVFTRIADLVASKRVLPAPAPTTGGLSADRITQLRELATLRDQGILTDEEFQAEKARILRR